jgi:murein DD-endopeptidase MepM/ murein hydrolase activator NlpD
MNDKSASQDALQEQNNKPPQPTSTDESPQILKGWDFFWERVSRLGLAEVALRVGSALVTISLVGLIIWVMKDFFLGGSMNASNAEAIGLTGGGQNNGVELPAYAGVAPVEGLSRSVEAHTPEEVASRYDFVQYTVQEGDSIWAIAEKFGIQPQSILWCNYDVLYDNPAAIYPGQVLTIPPTDGVLYTWHEGDGLNGVSSGLGVTPEDIIDWPGNNLSVATVGDYAHPNIAVGTQIFAPGGSKEFVDWTNSLFTRDQAATSESLWGEGKCAPVVGGFTGTGTYIWPTSEHFISGYEYSPEINHWGIDIGGDTGNPIYATDSGVVVYAGWSAVGYGNVIAIDHGENADGKVVQSVYAHLSAINVSCGASVYQGNIIGYMGSTGNSTGPHLHFELIVGTFKVNPHAYLGE